MQTVQRLLGLLLQLFLLLVAFLLGGLVLGLELLHLLSQIANSVFDDLGDSTTVGLDGGFDHFDALSDGIDIEQALSINKATNTK
jgi:hypothetical protein